MPIKDKLASRTYQREWARKNKVSRTVEKRAIRCTPRGRAMALNRGARSRAVKRKILYDLTTEWTEQAILNGCAVTGHMFTLDIDAIHMDILAPSLDKIDPDKGYTMDNVQVICLGANKLKGSNSLKAMHEVSSMITKRELLRLKDHEHMMPV